MARKKAEDVTHTKGTAEANGKPESVSGYFRQIFKENPKLLHETSNAKILERWLADHPDQPEVPRTVKQNLANLKSMLRSKKRGRVAERAQGPRDAAHEGRSLAATVPTGGSALELLEHHIDECLILAKTQDRAELESVISLLRRARNAVVWKMGL